MLGDSLGIIGNEMFCLGVRWDGGEGGCVFCSVCIRRLDQNLP